MIWRLKQVFFCFLVREPECPQSFDLRILISEKVDKSSDREKVTIKTGCEKSVLHPKVSSLEHLTGVLITVNAR